MTNSRRKNKHPKRAENVKTVVVVTKTSGGAREEEEGDEDVERLRRMLMCVPCDDGVEQNHQMRKEETAIIAKGVKRKRGGHECDVCEKRFISILVVWQHCVLFKKRASDFTRTRNRTSAMSAIKLFVNLVI